MDLPASVAFLINRTELLGRRLSALKGVISAMAEGIHVYYSALSQCTGAPVLFANGVLETCSRLYRGAGRVIDACACRFCPGIFA